MHVYLNAESEKEKKRASEALSSEKGLHCTLKESVHVVHCDSRDAHYNKLITVYRNHNQVYSDEHKKSNLFLNLKRYETVDLTSNMRE